MPWPAEEMYGHPGFELPLAAPAPNPVSYTRGSMPMGQFVDGSPQPACYVAWLSGLLYRDVYSPNVSLGVLVTDLSVLPRMQFPPGSIDVQEDGKAFDVPSAIPLEAGPSYNRESGIPGEIQIPMSQVCSDLPFVRVASPECNFGDRVHRTICYRAEFPYATHIFILNVFGLARWRLQWRRRRPGRTGLYTCRPGQ